jgi:pyruvate dehydrogenase E2 component (dihydrolipoamide acetyltransferase)
MATPVQMPQMGESVVEGTILKWLKSEGDAVEVDEPLVEVSTDKVDTEIPSPVAGTLVKVLVQEGDTVEVGTSIAEIDQEGGGAEPKAEAEPEVEEEPKADEAKAEEEPKADEEPEAEAAAEEGAEQAPAEEPASEGSPDEDAPERQAAPERKASERPAASAAPERGGPPTRTDEGKGPGQVLSPLVRRLAREQNVDLSQVKGTGAGGRVTKQDVLTAAERGAAAPAAPAKSEAPPAQRAAPPVSRESAGAREEAVPLSHIRKRIAEHMVSSLQTSARAWNAIDVDMESIEQLRREVNPAFKAREGFSLTYLPFICRAVCDALMTEPAVNASISEDLSEATYHHYVNIGIAVATDYGLIVPVIKGAEGLNVVGIARAIRELADKARTKKLAPDDVSGSTFSITNPGPFGSYVSLPVINQPNVAILGTEAVEKRVVVVDDMIAIRHRTFLTMSWDHRLLDGADAMRFLARLKENLETWDFSHEVG